MTDFAQTISNTVALYGGEPTTKWGSATSMVWGVSLWTYSSEMPKEPEKVLPNSLTFSDTAFVYDVEKVVSEAVALDMALIRETERSISESLSLESNPTVESLRDPAGYFLVFKRPTTNAENRVETSYNSSSANSNTFTSQVRTQISWSSNA